MLECRAILSDRFFALLGTSLLAFRRAFVKRTSFIGSCDIDGSTGLFDISNKHAGNMRLFAQFRNSVIFVKHLSVNLSKMGRTVWGVQVV